MYLLGALPLLMIVGTLLAISVLLSKIAAGLHAPMLTYLVLAMVGSGIVLLVMNGGIRRRRSRLGSLAAYSLVAGGLMALGSALGYLTVHAVGAAFIALALAFPPMLTWLLSLALRMERFDALRATGLLIGLAGGILLAAGKQIAAPSDLAAVLAACAIPAVLAAGNVFRTRFWPKGASPRELADVMLICGGALTLPFAVAFEGASAITRVLQPPMLLVLAGAIMTFVAQYAALFRLQQIAGPVYMSQIGSVAALVGSPVAVLALGERLPDGFATGDGRPQLFVRY
ncbi:MAG: DMT family transporter [Steroidobacteraceae bacterium]